MGSRVREAGDIKGRAGRIGRDLRMHHETQEGGPMKKCPSCAEQIQHEAIVCRYCGRNVPSPELSPEEKLEDAKRKLDQQRLTWQGWALLLVSIPGLVATSAIAELKLGWSLGAMSSMCWFALSVGYSLGFQQKAPPPFRTAFVVLVVAVNL